MHDASEALAFIANGTDLVVSGFNGEPVEILDAVEQAAADHLRHGLTVHEMFPTKTRRSMRGEFAQELAHTSYFLSDTDRAYLGRGVEFVPASLSEVPALIARRAKSQPLVLATIAAHNGRLYWGTNGEYAAALVRDGAPTIVEINAQMPYLPQCPFPEIQVLAALHTDRPMLEILPPPISRTDERIADLVAERIPSGATLQIGIGGVPDLVCEALKADGCDLRVHTEMLSDGLALLIQSGATSVSAAMPALAAFAMGTAALYEFMDGNPAVRIGPADEVNDPARIAALPKMTSVCATTEVDLYGQCVSGTVGGRWYSGPGGQLDFMRGVHASPDGQGFMVLRSTLKTGSSRIKLSLSPLSAVTTGIDLVDKIVTEHGVAELAGRSLSERAHAMIAIAAPEHREKLRFQAHQAELL
ncbi:MAG: acetyl-CoA hydrolase/transferase family protein [Solirubrobacteraceae bacterium]